MARNIVICCDGTGNEVERNLSNVLKLFRTLEKNERQRVYYNPGVGTVGLRSTWQRMKQNVRGVFGLVTGYGLDDDVLAAYRFLAQTYAPGDRIWLFGFSRGAYTVRVLAAFLHVIGLLPPDQLNLAGSALTAYKRASARSRKKGGAGSGIDPDLAEAWHFSRVAGADPVQIEFVGVWDTVASIIVPRPDYFGFSLQTLRYTRTNPSVKAFRQAMAIDERRRMFRLNRWTEPQRFRSNPFDAASETDQDVRQVWFAGVHADVGGGYPETESGLAKFPLGWMIEEAVARGLRVNRAMVNHLVQGKPRAGSSHVYVAPDATAPAHDSLTWGWKPLEWLPKLARWREWPRRTVLLGRYLPRAEPRPIAEGALLHWSVVERMARVPDYRPPNLPEHYAVEQAPAKVPQARPATEAKTERSSG